MSWQEWGPSPGSALQRASSLALAALIMMLSRAAGRRALADAASPTAGAQRAVITALASLASLAAKVSV